MPCILLWRITTSGSVVFSKNLSGVLRLLRFLTWGVVRSRARTLRAPTIQDVFVLAPPARFRSMRRPPIPASIEPKLHCRFSFGRMLCFLTNIPASLLIWRARTLPSVARLPVDGSVEPQARSALLASNVSPVSICPSHVWLGWTD